MVTFSQGGMSGFTSTTTMRIAATPSSTTPGTIGRPGKWPGRLGWSWGIENCMAREPLWRESMIGAAHARKRASGETLSAAVAARTPARAAPCAA